MRQKVEEGHPRRFVGNEAAVVVEEPPFDGALVTRKAQLTDLLEGSAVGAQGEPIVDSVLVELANKAQQNDRTERRPLVGIHVV